MASTIHIQGRVVDTIHRTEKAGGLYILSNLSILESTVGTSECAGNGSSLDHSGEQMKPGQVDDVCDNSNIQVDPHGHGNSVLQLSHLNSLSHSLRTNVALECGLNLHP